MTRAQLAQVVAAAARKGDWSWIATFAELHGAIADPETPTLVRANFIEHARGMLGKHTAQHDDRWVEAAKRDAYKAKAAYERAQAMKTRPIRRSGGRAWRPSPCCGCRSIARAIDESADRITLECASCSKAWTEHASASLRPRVVRREADGLAAVIELVPRAREHSPSTE